MKASSRFSVIFLLVFCLRIPLIAENIISSYTEQRVGDFSDLHMRLSTCQSNAEALKAIDEFEEETRIKLQEQAVDLEQEQLILESLYLMERYHYLYDPQKNRKELRLLMKEQMKKNEACIDARAKNRVSKWLYLFTGDVISFYMTAHSPAAVFRYGMHVKNLYEKAIKLDPKLTNANINLGNWFFYAPALFGGGLEKAGARYKIAFDGARNDGERYVASIYLSQYYFEKKQPESTKEYLDLADSFNPGGKEVILIRRLNKNGVSLFAYNRDKTGIDVKENEVPEDED